MRFRHSLLALTFTVGMPAAAFAQNASSSTSYQPVPTAKLGEIEGMVVYGERPSAGAIVRLHDESLKLETSRVLFIKEALELAHRNPVQLDVFFAPRSAALNALGREQLDLIATSMRITDSDLNFLLIPSDNPKQLTRSLSKLEMARINNVLFYINTQQQLGNRIQLPEGLTDRVRPQTPWSEDEDNSLRITLIHEEQTASLKPDELELPLN